MKFKIIISRLIFIIPLMFIHSMCSTDNTGQIPYVRMQMNLGLFNELQGIGELSYVLIDGGVNGLIVYRETGDVFHVYDRTCTQWPEHDAAVADDGSGNFILKCPECGSEFSILLGAEPIKGPALFGLKEYYSSFDGISTLTVIN